MLSMGFEPLTPTAFLHRSALVFRDRVAIVDGARSFTFQEFEQRSLRLAGALASSGVGPGDRVAVLVGNTHVSLEAHHGVPWAGAVLVALNTRLAAAELAFIVDHCDARVLIHDESLADVARAVADLAEGAPRLISSGVAGDEFEDWIGSADELCVAVDDERSLLAINYTSGTTGRPKGVEYHHRGAYLQAMAMAYHMRLDSTSSMLWTLPTFHCNGWCFPWAATGAGARQLCLRRVDPSDIWRRVRDDGVTHFNAAPTVLTMLADQPDAERLERTVHVGTGGAPPSPTLLDRMGALNVSVTHLYGLTETFGPTVICDWHSEWNELDRDRRAAMAARQGVGNLVAGRARVVTEAGVDVPRDGNTMGEVVLRGNTVMRGYHRDPEATAAVDLDGWFRTGDLAVMHPDGYLELRDRAKDIVISGGENISSIEVEQVLVRHPAVGEAAVVAIADERWGEVPVAFVSLRPGADVSEHELIEHVRGALAHFKAPKRVVFGDLPKTSTGKVQKHVLRASLAG